MTQIVVLIPTVLFFGWVAPDVGNDISWGAVAVTAAVAAVAISALLTVGFKDPGSIPPNEPCSLPDMCVPPRGALRAAMEHCVLPKPRLDGLRSAEAPCRGAEYQSPGAALHAGRMSPPF